MQRYNPDVLYYLQKVLQPSGLISEYDVCHSTRLSDCLVYAHTIFHFSTPFSYFIAYL